MNATINYKIFAGLMRQESEKTMGEALLEAIKDALASPSNGKIVRPIYRSPSEVRRRLQMTQLQFAKEFHINIKTLQQCKQGVRQPDSAACAYLECISKAPEQIRNILQGS
jgi:DNA-binding transcriptional regulator YiaG